MEKPNFNTADLIKRYLDGTCTEAERQLVEDWYLSFPDAKQKIDKAQMEHDLRILDKRMQRGFHKASKSLWPKLVAAAIVLLISLLALAYYLYVRSLQKYNPSQLVQFDEVVKPGGNQASLILPDGRTIQLSRDKLGIVAQGDSLAYTDGTRIDEADKGTSVASYQLQTPRGGQYQLTLPDGSRVWLNAESKLIYPTSFNTKDRQVELIGEAYFEVNGDPHKPFKVISQGRAVDVLGTAFNLTAYADDPGFCITLVSGSVQVAPDLNSKDGSSFVRLLPGEEAVLIQGGKLAKRKADVELATAWKEGLFSFRQADLQTVMKTLSRWYNMEVNFEGKIPEWQFSGKFHRSDKASKVLDLLDYYGIHYRVEENRITIIGE